MTNSRLEQHFREAARELYDAGYKAEDLRELCKKRNLIESEEERARWQRSMKHKDKMDAFSGQLLDSWGKM